MAGPLPPQNDPPPAYTAPPLGTRIACSRWDSRGPARLYRLKQFRRYMIEILGFAVNADFSLLNQALGQPVPTASPPTSILTDEERAELLHISLLLETLLEKSSEKGPGWLSVRTSDRRTIVDAIVRPLNLLPGSYYCQIGFVMEIIAGYSSHQCNASQRSLSSIMQEKPRHFEFWRKLTFLGPFNFPMWSFCHNLGDHVVIMERMSLNDDCKNVLAEAFERYRVEELGLGAYAISCRHDDFIRMGIGHRWRELDRRLGEWKEEEEEDEDRDWRRDRMWT